MTIHQETLRQQRQHLSGGTHRRTVAGAIIASTIAGVIALTGGAATAVELPGNEQESKICFEQVPFEEYQYKKTVTTPNSHVESRWDIETRSEKLKDIINKETSIRTWTADVWQNFSPNKNQGPFDGPPSWPTDPRGTWQHQDKEIPGGHQGPNGVYQNGNGNSSWFYRAAGFWSGWGPWTDWPDAPVIDDGRARGPLLHGSGTGWERQYRYVVVGQSPNGYTDWAPARSTDWGLSDTPSADTATTRYVNKQQRTVEDGPTVTVYFYNDGDVSTEDKGIWTTDTNLDRSWVLVGERTVYENGDRIPCGEKPPTPVPVVSTKWGDCSTGVDLVFGEERTTTYKYVLEDFEWVKVVDTDVTVNVQRPLSEDEQAACQPPVTTEPSVATEPPTTEPPTTAPPTVEPIVEALPPIPSIATQGGQLPATSAVSATQLPATGSSAWSTILLALAALGAGAVFLRLSRRSV